MSWHMQRRIQLHDLVQGSVQVTAQGRLCNVSCLPQVLLNHAGHAFACVSCKSDIILSAWTQGSFGEHGCWSHSKSRYLSGSQSPMQSQAARPSTRCDSHMYQDHCLPCRGQQDRWSLVLMSGAKGSRTLERGRPVVEAIEPRIPYHQC